MLPGAVAGATEIPEIEPVMAEFEASVAAIDWVPAVLSVTVKVKVPSLAVVNVWLAGKIAWASLLVKLIVPV